jgi:hypothetical protein
VGVRALSMLVAPRTLLWLLPQALLGLARALLGLAPMRLGSMLVVIAIERTSGSHSLAS